jgi:hypothetical protein
MLNAITAPSFRPAIFVDLTFDNAGTLVPVNIWSGLGGLTTAIVNGASTTWTGLGSLLSIGAIEEGSTVEARGIVIELNGLDPVLLPGALTEFNLGLPVTIWLAAMSSGLPVVSPLILFSGVTDQPSLNIGPDAVKLSIACENLLISHDVPVERRLTPQDQQMNWPGDAGLQFVFSLMNIALTWGGIGKGAPGASQGSNAI